MERTGDLYQTQGEATYEWIIKNFSLLPAEVNTRIEGPNFCYSGESWYFRMYTNGKTTDKTENYINLYLAKKSSGCPVSVSYSFAFKNVLGKADLNRNFTYVFREKNIGYGFPKMVLRSGLMARKCELLPSDTLTVICCLKNSEKNDVSGSIFCRLEELSTHFSEIYEKSQLTDLQLKVEEKIFEGHRLVLQARSPVFAAMFNHDMKENQTGEVSIPDLEASAMETLLTYMYSGDIDDLTPENTFSIYEAAHKYDIKKVKEMCLKFIRKNLSVKWVCDVIKFADLYEEEEVRRLARDYFIENASDILESDPWDTFLKENHEMGLELLSTAVKTLSKK